MTCPAPDDSLTMPSSSAPSVSPVFNMSGARSVISSSMASPVPIRLAITVTPSGMPRKFNTRLLFRADSSASAVWASSATALIALLKPSTNLMVATAMFVADGASHCRPDAAVTAMSSPVVTSASLTGLPLAAVPLTVTAAVISSPFPIAEASAMMPPIVTVPPSSER